MSALAAPAPEAEFASGMSLAGQLNISTPPAHPHGFTLELGSATRFTFAASSLAPRLGVQATDVSAFVEALVNLATRDDSGTVLRGCDALDSLLCAEVEQAPGCVNAACLAGLKALAQLLDTSFSALDGQDLDFPCPAQPRLSIAMATAMRMRWAARPTTWEDQASGRPCSRTAAEARASTARGQRSARPLPAHDWRRSGRGVMMHPGGVP